jgi:hypothetical protein
MPYNPQRFHFCTPDGHPGIWNFWDRVLDVNKLCYPPNPIGLQVSKQSRQETLRHYSLLFEHANGFKRYFDPYKDQILTTSLFPRLSQMPCEWHRYYFEEISGERWKGECTVQYLEIHEFAWWNVGHPGTSQSIPDFRGIGHYFQALVKLVIYPREQYCRRNISNFYNPRVLECYEFFDREFIRAKEELNWDGYKIPEITIVFPSNGDPKLTRLEQIDQARRNYNLLAG